MALNEKREASPTPGKISRAHFVQSAAAGIYILAAFTITHSFHSNLAVASLGASAFIAFSSPESPNSCPKTLIGGYFFGVLSGLLCNGAKLLLGGLISPAYIPACAGAVFLSMLLMTVFGFKHPPAAALAAAVTIDKNPFVMSIEGIVCILALCIIKEGLKKYMRNL